MRCKLFSVLFKNKLSFLFLKEERKEYDLVESLVSRFGKRK